MVQIIPGAMIFEYAIRFPSTIPEHAAQGVMGLYYTGPSYVGKKRERKDDRANQGTARDAYTYTEPRAYALILSNQSVFHGCKVERVL